MYPLQIMQLQNALVIALVISLVGGGGMFINNIIFTIYYFKTKLYLLNI